MQKERTFEKAPEMDINIRFSDRVFKIMYHKTKPYFKNVILDYHSWVRIEKKNYNDILVIEYPWRIRGIFRL